jgi:hypothetical protein
MSALPHLLHQHHMRGVRARMRPRWAREDADRLLAEGVEPGVDRLLQARADRLVKPAARAKLAAELERVVAERRGPASGACHELMRLAGELRHMPNPRACGVAMAELLLTDRSSPLQTASSSDEIARAARAAADNMRGA